MSIEERWREQLNRLRSEGRYRSLRPAGGVDFCSNDYLGLGRRSATLSAQAPAGLPSSGLASRLLRGHHPVWDEVETVLARWHGADAALVFTSGYVANEGLLAAILAANDV